MGLLPGKRVWKIALATAFAFALGVSSSAQDLGSGQFQILGTSLDIAPESQAVPVSIPTVIHTSLPVAAGTKLPADVFVRGELTGPGLAAAASLVTTPNSDFVIPGQTVKGTYGRRTEIDRPEGIVTKFEFDANNNLTNVTAEPGDRVTQYGYDVQNRLLSITYPDQKSLTYGYDEDGNVVSETESPGSTITITPDENGRPLRRDFAKGTGVEGPDFESFTYDALGRVVSADNGEAKIDMAYDSLDAMTGDQLTTLAGIYSTGKTYDLAGNPISISYPSGRSITLVPDPLDRIAAIREGGNLIGSYVFQGPSLTAKKVLGNNLAVATTFDAMRRPTDLLAADPAGNPALHHQYGWTATNRKSFATLSDGKSSVYGYDTALRLTSESLGVPGDPGNPSGAPAATKAFGYDTANALTSLNDSRIGSQTAANDSVNRLISLGALTVNWDTEGNLSTKSSGDHIVYDAAHRPVRIEHGDGSVEVFRYDALGRRFEKSITVGGTTNTTTEVSCGEHVIAEYLNGRLDREYVLGNEADELVQIKRDTDGDGILDQTLYPLTDEMNTVHALTDQNGQVVERYAYEADGRSIVLEADFSPRSFSLFGNTINWEGRPWTGSYGYFRNRWLDSETHSWLTPDPAHYPDQIANAYAPFGRDGGVNTEDPWGLYYLVSVREDFKKLTWRRQCDSNGCVYRALDKRPVATIFVHGYNVDSDNAEYRSLFVESRLALSGYYGSVIGLTWPGNVGWNFHRDAGFVFATPLFQYDIAEARRSGSGLAQLVREIRTYTKAGLKLNVVSHSLGAEVLLSGLELLAKDGKRLVDVAAMTEAAVPAAYLMTGPNPFAEDELIGGYGRQGRIASSLRHADWGRYKDAPAAADQMFSFYSGTDSVLGNIYPLANGYTALGLKRDPGLLRLGILDRTHQINTAPGALNPACPVCGIKNHSSMIEDSSDITKVFWDALVDKLKDR